jgi:hypothetical protein
VKTYPISWNFPDRLGYFPDFGQLAEMKFRDNFPDKPGDRIKGVHLHSEVSHARFETDSFLGIITIPQIKEKYFDASFPSRDHPVGLLWFILLEMKLPIGYRKSNRRNNLASSLIAHSPPPNNSRPGSGTANSHELLR